MKSVLKLFFVLIVFSAVFFTLRYYGSQLDYNVETLVLDLGGLTYLYSTVGTIFAVFAAFVIVTESQDWNMLVNASKNELRELNELWLWSKNLSPSLHKKFDELIQKYLDKVVSDEWQKLSWGEENFETEEILNQCHLLLAEAVKENQQISPALFSAFGNILNYRSTRLEYSWEPLAKILKLTIILVAGALIGLSLFIGVHNMWLDYIFMLCIVTLSTVILLVVDDLDNPLRPGDWCLTPHGYKRLLKDIQSRKWD